MPIDKIKKLIDIIDSYDIPLGILTNGYNILGLGDDYLYKLDHIVLNGHGLNEEYLDEIEPILRGMNGAKIHRLQRYDYYDMGWVADNSPKSGDVCVIYNKIAGFYKGVLYPCCGPYYCNEKCARYMGDWNVHSPIFYDTVQDLKNLPKAFWGDCLNHCAFNAVYQPTLDIRGKVTGVVRPPLCMEPDKAPQRNESS
jgi:hypothetical protein